jgi:histidinol dehydrogenase
MMKTIIYPPGERWERLCMRPAADNQEIDATVQSILARVKSEGDRAIREMSLKFDGAHLDDLKVTERELEDSLRSVTPELKRALSTAKENIEKFHSAQLTVEKTIETQPGVMCRRKNIPVERAGLYVPGGSAPLFSTVLMLAVPAKIAGCKRIIMCTPPDKRGKINPLILYSAMITGVTEIYKTGGAQAVAAMAYGTETIPRVDKIFGPGNRFVTKAKEIVQTQGIAIDMPAGPSEVLIIADKNADPEFIAADLLAQAEHGPDSQILLVTDHRPLLKSVSGEIMKQIRNLQRKAIALKALNNSLLVLLADLDKCIDFSNQYAPEHLIINTSEAAALAEKVINAGSVFIGEYSCESSGDYASGPNHTLPTNGYARSFSGLSTDSFVKKITFQEISSTGIKNIGPVVEIMAEAESLYGHKNAVTVRLKRLKNE